MGCQTVLVSKNAVSRSVPGSRDQSGSTSSGLLTRLRLSAAATSRSRQSAIGTPVRSRPLTSACEASQGATSATRPVSMLTTPPGRSDVASTSVNVIAGSGRNSLAITTVVLPVAITGSSTDTKPSRLDDGGATIATTPVGSGTEKSKNGPATGFAAPTTCAILSVQI